MDERTIADYDVQEIHQYVTDFLVRREYDYVCVLNLEDQMIFVDTDRLRQEWDWTGEMHSYEEARKKLVDVLIDANDIEDFMRLSEPERIASELEQAEEYSFMFHAEKRCKREWKYSWLDRERHLVLATLKDVTDLLERDHMTGVLNRYGFIRKAREVLWDDSLTNTFAILYFNIKGFKAINKLFGTEGGDEALRRAVQVLRRSNLRPYAVGRFEADHFVCLVDRDRIDEEELREMLQQTFRVNQHLMDVYALCGIYVIRDEERRESVSNMCDRARLANSYIEDEYVKPYAFFDSKMIESYMEKDDAMRQLNTAIERQEFKVYYQPVHDALTGEIVSAEALVRWQKENGEMVSPNVFVPVLEETGRISQMDLLVERSVLAFMEDRYHKNKFIVPVSMNMSQMDFFDKDMMATVLLDVSNTDLPMDYTRFEVTETAYSIVTSNNRNALLDMKQIGVKFYLDDFGSGYSSFSTIRDYDFDVIKLDMGFVTKVGTSEKADAVIRAVIDMAHAIGTKVVAEGAETKEQVEALRDLGCDYIQGFYFSKPLPEKEFEALLDQQLPL